MAKKKDRPSWFKMFIHQKAVIDSVPDETAGKALKAVFAYFEDGEIPIIDPLAFAVFSAIKPYVDESFADFEQTRKKNSENVKKRWARTKGKTDDTDGINGMNDVPPDTTGTSGTNGIPPNTNHTEADAEADASYKGNKANKVEREEGEKGIQGDTRDVFPEENTTAQKFPHSLPAFDPPLTGRQEEIFLMAVQTGMGYEKAASLIHRPLKAKEGEGH